MAGLDYLFNPKTVAVVGVSTDSTNYGQKYMVSLKDCGFKGNIYAVNPKGGEIFGSRIYPNVKDIPGTVDYVISTIPAAHTSQLLEDCAAKRVKAIHFFASGFSEIEDNKGEKMESEMFESARRNGIRILGPNCMGIYCPKTGLSFSVDYPRQSCFPTQSGSLGLLSQSGSNSIFCIRDAVARSIYFSKVISYGNAPDLDETDFLEYLTDDPETKVIAAYIEGVKDGVRFASTLMKAAKIKPVIVYKGGLTDSGIRATASHTGSIAGSQIVWESLLKQAGIIQVHSMEELVDQAQLFLRVRKPKGRNTAVIGAGGGPSVLAADECSKAGLTLAAPPQHVKQKMKEIYKTEAGSMFRNPFDIAARGTHEFLEKSILEISSCDQYDLLIIHLSFDNNSLGQRGGTPKFYVDSILNLKDRMAKPVAVALHQCSTMEGKEDAWELQRRLCEAGVPVYPSVSRAAIAMNSFIQHHG